MISQFLIDLAAGFVSFIAGLFPVWEPPAWMSDTPDMLMDFLAGFNGLGVWVDWTALGICIGAVVTVYLVGSGIRLLRVIISHLPMVGGGG